MSGNRYTYLYAIARPILRIPGAFFPHVVISFARLPFCATHVVYYVCRSFISLDELWKEHHGSTSCCVGVFYRRCDFSWNDACRRVVIE